MLTSRRGREARPTSVAWVVAKTLAQMAVFWTLFLAVLPAGVYALESAVGLDGWRFDGGPGRWAGPRGWQGPDDSDGCPRRGESAAVGWNEGEWH